MSTEGTARYTVIFLSRLSCLKISSVLNTPIVSTCLSSNRGETLLTPPPVDQTNNQPVYGLPLEQHLDRIGQPVSTVMHDCCIALREKWMDTEGIFRIAASAAKLKLLRVCGLYTTIGDSHMHTHTHMITNANSHVHTLTHMSYSHSLDRYTALPIIRAISFYMYLVVFFLRIHLMLAMLISQFMILMQ